MHSGFVSLHMHYMVSHSTLRHVTGFSQNTDISAKSGGHGGVLSEKIESKINAVAQEEENSQLDRDLTFYMTEMRPEPFEIQVK